MSASVTALYWPGSNLGESVLRTRCPGARQVGMRRSTVIASASRGNRTIGVEVLRIFVPAPASTVWGALFNLGEDGFERLDEYEGVPWAGPAR